MPDRRRPPDDHDADRTHAVPPAAQAGEAQAAGGTRAAANAPITHIKALPKGSYWSFAEHGITAIFAESFAVIAQGAGHAVLLVASESFSSHPQFDLQRRMRAAGLPRLSVRRASREIVRAVHAMHASERGGPGLEASDAEASAWEIIDQAIDQGASDIHIETRTTFAQVFYRIHGDRVEQPNISVATATQICNVLYLVHGDSDSSTTSWDPKQVQSTSIERRSRSGKPAQLRFSSRPIHPSGNFKAVMRVLVMDASSSKSLEEIGHTPAQREAMENALVGAQGMVLVVGPTNSGKSTLMQALVRRIYDMRGNTISVDTLEDPVEYIMPRASQTAVPEGRRALEDRTTGSAYTTFLNGFLRQDPDVMIIAEIRGAESAEAAKNAVLGGRKMLTTLHAYDPFAVFPRLREIGVPPSVLFMPGFISGVIYQRLVRVLCPHCAIPLHEAWALQRIRRATFERAVRVAGEGASRVMTVGHGCEKCNLTGIVGRAPCAAVLVPDQAILTLLAAGDELGARRHWQAFRHLDIGGMGVSAIAHAIDRMKNGELDPSDIEAQIGLLAPDAIDAAAPVPAGTQAS